MTSSALHGGPGWAPVVIGVCLLVALRLSQVLPPDSLAGRALTSLLQGVGPLRSDEPSVPRYVAVGLIVGSITLITLGSVLIATGH